MKPSTKTFSLAITLLLAVSALGACQREAYQPTPTPDDAVSAPLSTPSATPGLAADTNPATPQPDWETLYAEEDPVTDPEEIIAILQDLYGRFMAELDQPGWYRFYAGEVDKDVSWVHISTPESHQFDGLFRFYNSERYPPGFINLVAVVGPDGQIGFPRNTEVMNDYYFVERPDVFSFLDDLEPSLDNIGYFVGDVDGAGQFGHLILLRAIRGVQNPVHDHGAAHSESSYMGWVGTYEGRPVFVLKTTTLYSGVLPVMESGERLVRDESYTYFDLQNGGAIVNISDNYYQSGNVDLGEENQPTWFNFNLVEWFEVLPEREQQIYDEALRRLDEFNQSGIAN